MMGDLQEQHLHLPRNHLESHLLHPTPQLPRHQAIRHPRHYRPLVPRIPR